MNKHLWLIILLVSQYPIAVAQGAESKGTATVGNISINFPSVWTEKVKSKVQVSVVNNDGYTYQDLVLALIWLATGKVKEESLDFPDVPSGETVTQTFQVLPPIIGIYTLNASLLSGAYTLYSVARTVTVIAYTEAVPPPSGLPRIIAYGVYNIIVEARDTYSIPLEDVHVEIWQELIGRSILEGATDEYGQFIALDLEPNQYYTVKTYYLEQEKTQTVYLDDYEERLLFEFGETLVSLPVTFAKYVNMLAGRFLKYVISEVTTPPVTIPDIIINVTIGFLAIGPFLPALKRRLK